MSDAPAETRPEAVSDGSVRVRRALVSVSDKTGVADFARGLAALGVEILSTGGTAGALREAGVEVVDVAEFTGQQEILDGRVKTLHPRLHAALLARRDDPAHRQTLEREGIEPIDLVCVNLYPFEQTVARDQIDPRVAIENIDIGGPTMIRAAAKNHDGVAVVVKPESYDAVLAELEESGGEISQSRGTGSPTRRSPRPPATTRRSARWFSTHYEDFPEHLAVAYEKVLDLSYGENPHQRGALYAEAGGRSHVLSRVSKLHGRALSFNNVLDLDSARRLVADFDQPACVIVKHNNPCGVAIGESGLDAYEKALACDPMSAFGGVIALNRPVDGELAEALNENFVEVLIAPGYEEGGARRPAEQGGDPHPPRRGAARRRPGRARRQAGSRRAADPGPRRRPRAARADGGGDRDPARRGPVAGHDLRLDGGTPGALERDRDRQGRRHPGDRRRADEPCRLGAAGRGEVPRGARRRGRIAARPARRWPPTPSSPSPTAPRRRSRPERGR